MWLLALTLGIFGLGAVYCEEEKVFRVAGTDSYLEAYKATRGNNVNALLDDAVKKIDREFVESGPSGYAYPNPQPQYGPPQGYNYVPQRPQYGPPNLGPAYGPPNIAYGPPNAAPAYGPPNPPPPPAYGPPAPPPPIYGPPAPQPPVYGPPSSSSITQVFYGVPHAMLSFWDKLKLKLDLFTIGKILLKLVIFKKIVSFIAILCLLLFIPALKHKVENNNSETYPSSDEDDMLMRSLHEARNGNKLNNLAAYVVEAIENFPNTEGSRTNCESTYCRTQKALKELNKVMSYDRLAKLYSKELHA